MRQFRRYNVASLILGVLVLVGCASQQESEPAAQPEAPVEVAPVQTQPVQAEPEATDFDNRSRPLMPSGRILATKFYFELDQARLSARDLRLLEMHANILTRNRDRRLVIEGHCDERGTREYNLALGERRANAVSSFLTSAGVRRSQIDTVSYGEERPDDPGHDESAWSKTRRAVVIYR